ncbi:MAG: pyridoxamine 5'-phosphate oxidase family protein [Acidimicrobiales bacterium]|nr:pyridoxamine 5'-phosphate oxidase family protein [Acidimicrobiales bacterium]
MASWSTFEHEAPELAASVRSRFAANPHHVLGTLRRDGSPRLSGTEVHIHDGEVWLGVMPGSRKLDDVRRDPRCALHSAPLETDLAAGDAKLAGRAEEVADPARRAAVLAAIAPQDAPVDGSLLRLDLGEASLVTVRGDRLHVDTWHPGGPADHVERR